MNDIVHDIKAKLDIVTVVSDYVILKKAGRNFKGLSPFKKENTPSFIVSPDKQLAYCFGTQKGGDIFSFIMEIENVDFRGAIEYLAEKAGLSLPDYHASTSKIPKTQVDTYRNIVNAAKDFFLSQKKTIADYLVKRNIDSPTIDAFELGYAPNGKDLLFMYLTTDHGFSPKDIEKVGLVTFHDGIYFDKFRDRLMFPIYNSLKSLAGFAGRIIEKGEPKYLNSPETPIYDKGAMLYGLHLAKEAIKEKGFVIVVEGYMDVISSYQHGLRNIVALAGTALTDKQINLLKRYTDNIYFMFDNDSAGFEATQRNATLLAKEDVRLFILSLDKYGVKDIDEFFEKNADEDFQLVLENKVSYTEFALIKLIEKVGIGTLEKKISIIHYLLPYITSLSNLVERDYALEIVAAKLSLRYDTVRAEVLRTKTVRSHKNVSEKQHEQVSTLSIILGVFFVIPKLFEYFTKEIDLLEPVSDFEKFIKRTLLGNIEFYKEKPADLAIPEGEFKKEFELLLLFLEEHNMVANEESALKVLKNKFLQYKMAETENLMLKMKALEKSGNILDWKQNFDRITKLERIMRS